MRFGFEIGDEEREKWLARNTRWRGLFRRGVEFKQANSTQRPFFYREGRVETGGVGFNRGREDHAPASPR